jgi:hypothetical protein
MKYIIGIALDYIDEAENNKKSIKGLLKFILNEDNNGFAVIKNTLRINSYINKILKVGDYVRLTIFNPP